MENEFLYCPICNSKLLFNSIKSSDGKIDQTEFNCSMYNHYYGTHYHNFPQRNTYIENNLCISTCANEDGIKEMKERYEKYLKQAINNYYVKNVRHLGC